MIRTLAFAAAFVTLAAPVLAQSTGTLDPARRSLAPTGAPAAAATLPNTFDGPATAAVVAPPVAAPSQAEVTRADMAEGVLRVVIADLAQGELDAELFTTDLANRLRPQLATLRPVVQGFGALETIEPQGLNNGASQFLVTFANAATQWVIGLNDEGRVSALLFRPAPAESSEPETSEPTADAD
jgi:hypothetical protein